MWGEERATYENLKEWALECYFEGCRDHAVKKAWSHEQVMGYVAYQFDAGFDLPIEDLMWQVVLLVLSGGWLPQWDVEMRGAIADCIAKHGLDKLLVEVPNDEAETFLHDLGILQLI